MVLLQEDHIINRQLKKYIEQPNSANLIRLLLITNEQTCERLKTAKLEIKSSVTYTVSYSNTAAEKTRAQQ